MRICRVAALLTVVFLAGASPPSAAEPTPGPGPSPGPTTATTQPAAAPTGSTTLSLPDLGAGPTIGFTLVKQDNASASVTFAVPTGMVPVALRAKADLPVNLRFGNITVTQGERTISRIGLPAQDGADVVIPLRDVRPAGNQVTLNLRMVALTQDPYCWDNAAPIRLTAASIDFAGAETRPANVASFLPPVLRRVVIALPAKPSAAESTAAVRVATAIAGRNSQKIDVSVLPLPQGKSSIDLPPAPLEREIVVKEGPEKGLSLLGGPGMPALMISGKADELPEQVRLLTADLLRFAASGKSAAGPLLEDRLLPSTTTLQEMNGGGIPAQGTAVIDVNQTRFGEPLRNIRIHLIGSHTPVPSALGGEVTVGVNGEVVDRWPTTPAGSIDTTVAIPDRLIRRSMAVQVAIGTTGDQSECNRVSVPLRIDGRTEISSEGANPPVPQGFQSLPQALMPGIRIGIGPDAFGDTARAVRIMVGLQRVSAVPLLSQVSDLQSALAGGGSAILVSSGGWNDQALALPFSSGGSQVSVQGTDASGQSQTLTLDREARFGSLQTVFDGPRALLVATSNGAPEALDGLLDWLAADRGRWAGIDGRAVIAVPGTEPVLVPNPPPAPSTSTGLGLPSASGSIWWIAGGVLALAALAAIVLWRRRSE